MPRLKISDAILKGMRRFPKQAIGELQDGKFAACVMGCANFGATGDATNWPYQVGRVSYHGWEKELSKFHCQYGVLPFELNNREVSREDIVGMFQAIGL